MSWEITAHNIIVDGESVLGYLTKGLNALKSMPQIEGYIGQIPFLESVAGRLVGLIPIVGQAASLLELADLGVQDWQAIAKLGASVGFRPYDSANTDLASQRLTERSTENN